MKTCTIDGCQSRVNAKGYCHRHYRRFRLYGDPLAPSRLGPRGAPPVSNPCAFAGCEKVGKTTKGYCPTHYMRLLRHGDAATVLPVGKIGKGRVKHPMYGAWLQMINRCQNPNNGSYPNYGGRGIRVCDRWKSDFHNYLADMGERPDGMTLDRIDPDGNYEPENCRWADALTQRHNHTEDGDARMRRGLSEGRKAYWRRWRLERGLGENETHRARRNAGKTK